jgi:xyloglucan-specific exo-beta-1,4-glucanase
MKNLFFIVFACVLSSSLYGQTGPYTWKNVQIVGGGFVPGIIYNQSQPGLVYARTDIGGAYRLDPATNKWIPLTDWIGWDDWGLTGIVSLATDAVDPNRLYLAAGTYTNSWDPKNGAILRSTDKGNTFQVTPLPFKLGGNMPGRGMGERLEIDPNKNSILYLGAPSGNGLWRSIDYGATWSRVTSFPVTGTYAEDPSDPNGYLNDPQGIVWVTFDKRTGTPGNTTQTIYVGVADKGNSVYRSTDGGNTWHAVPGQPTGYLPHKGKLDTVNGYLFVAYSDNGGPYGGEKGEVWRLNTATGAWTQISPIVASSGDNYFGYSGLAIDKQNPSTIMVTGYSSWWPDTHIWRSKDSGATWTRIWDWTRYPNRSFRYTHNITASPWLYWGGVPTSGGRPGAEVSPKLGWMTESLEIDPFNSNKMMYGTGATIYGTDNLTAWDTGGKITITVKAVGLEETAIQELVSPPAGPQLLSGMYDIYGFTHQNVDLVPNAFFENPRIATVSIDYAELLPSYMFRVGQGSADIKAAGYSTNGGSSWTPVTALPPGVVKGEGTCAVNATGKRIVWSPVDGAVHYSINNGKTWVACTGIPVGALVESDRVNENKFYGYKSGVFYVSTNGGASFTATVSNLSLTFQFKAVPGKEGHIWAAAGNGGMWRSVNSGTSFTQVTNVEEADNIGFGKAAAGQSYMAIYTSAKAGGIRGIFRSDNEGVAWTRVNDDQHQYGWTGKAITGDPRIYGRVYIATNGRGIIYGDIAVGGDGASALASREAGAEALVIAPNPVSSQEIRFIFKGERSQEMLVTITDFNGRQFHEQYITDINGEASVKLNQRLQPGVYVLHVHSANKVYSSRLVLK